MTGIQRVLLKARKQVLPSREEEALLNSVAAKVIKKVKVASLPFKEVTGVILGGSFAKQTWVPTGSPASADIDVFVKIAKEVDEKRFESIGLKVGREASRGYKHGKKFAQHPYTEATIDGVKVNIVPCYDVKPGEWRSAADRSPYHVRFVKRNFDGEKRMQVRLLKRFMKAVGVYGAEIENEGFSGYAAEVLVHNCGSFEGVLRFFAGLKPTGETLLSLRDPVDENRELAKAVSKETVGRMMLASRGFLERPELAYFTGFKREARRSLVGRLYIIRFDHRPLSEDTLWGELKEEHETTREVHRRAGFRGHQGLCSFQQPRKERDNPPPRDGSPLGSGGANRPGRRDVGGGQELHREEQGPVGADLGRR